MRVLSIIKYSHQISQKVSYGIIHKIDYNTFKVYDFMIKKHIFVSKKNVWCHYGVISENEFRESFPEELI